MGLIRTKQNRRRGSMLLEFAVVALLLYGILGIILTFGQLYFSAQVTQSAADLAAREISQTALPATITFEEALEHPQVRDRIYDEDYLAMDITDWVFDPADMTLYEYIDTVVNPPIVNKALYPVMFRQEINGRHYFRYPGALIEKGGIGGAYLTVQVPVVMGRDAEGIETIKWTNVIEEIDTEDESAPDTGLNPDAFPVTSPQRGIVALRMNLPFQSSTMAGGAPNFNTADDSAVTSLNSPLGGGFAADPYEEGHPYAGDKGLGRQYAVLKDVRPYRHLLSAQAIYRREVFE